MIHFTCDRCHCAIDAANSVRYVVHLDVQCVCQPPMEDDESVDHLSLLNEMLEAELESETRDHDRVDAASLPKGTALSCDSENALNPAGSLSPSDSVSPVSELETTSQQFDLCPDCYRKYRRNPLARERGLKLQFSNN